MRRLFGSVRARATLGATLVVAIALIAAGTAVLLSLRTNLVDQAGTQAESRARGIASTVASGRAWDRLDLPDDDDQPAQVVDDDGRLLAASEDLDAVSGTGTSAVRPDARALRDIAAPGAPDDDDDDSSDDAPGADPDDPAEISDDADLTNGSATIDGDTQDYRFAAVEVERDDHKVVVHAGAPLSAEQGAVRTALTVMLIGLPVLLVVVAAVTWLVTRRALRPVEGIRSEMAAITASQDLARRVPESEARDEIARLARTTNETLAALESSVERQRGFVADASHELRSPIASLRTQLEVGAAHPELLDLEGAVADTVRLQQLAADLLLLARLDAGERHGGKPVDLAALVREETAQRGGGGAEVRVEEIAAVEVVGARGQLSRVLGNLLDNAERHAVASVTVSLRESDGWVVVEVGDDGAGIPVDQRERIFERFVRLDDARARDDGGAGLGLAIARDVAVRHGGTLTVGESAAGGACFRLRLPRGGGAVL
ncbi:sensor histidine kinase [Streptomyces tsukubensis]|uniref:histidine kinase n=1 Tax=Streptomyces tsukubensis TaxID=83656 RepID=A0A1V4A8N9_9ACTN|nr:HAMP domain-containing sensor histidine kinase [Streptomyces tsukubensis]OON79581.1 two-component sensor histidine kinase [Streptomyces tsukubensis]QFR95763.1 HAMP domain-containing protein [Streptomyces tsukubensis]